MTLIISSGYIHDINGTLVSLTEILIVTGVHEVFEKRLLLWSPPYQRGF